ncbi:Inosine/uridine-preferring nucleoside hydrolase domain-containing protein [Scleroderma yunnanense]
MVPTKKIPVIIDTDPGVDDVLAILLALASPELEILAYIVSFGNTDVHSSYENIYRLYQAVGRQIASHPEDKARFPNYAPDVPPILVTGPDGPIEGERHSAIYFHGRDGLGNISQTHPDLNVSPDDKDHAFHANFTTTSKSGVQVALELLQSREERSITYIVLGPLTGLALLMRQHQEVVQKRIGRVVIMGGALDVPGNVTPAAEFNIFADAHAAKRLLCPASPENGLPLERVMLLPLDITTLHELTFPFYVERVDPTFESTRKPSIESNKPPLVHFSSAFFERSREVMIEFGKDVLELHDIAAVWCALENPPDSADKEVGLPSTSPGWIVMRRKFDIERTGETAGMMIPDRGTRALSQLEHHVPRSVDSNSPSAEAETDDLQIPTDPAEGVPYVVETPGPEALVRLLTKRVWGIDV